MQSCSREKDCERVLPFFVQLLNAAARTWILQHSSCSCSCGDLDPTTLLRTNSSQQQPSKSSFCCRSLRPVAAVALALFCFLFFLVVLQPNSVNPYKCVRQDMAGLVLSLYRNHPSRRSSRPYGDTTTGHSRTRPASSSLWLAFSVPSSDIPLKEICISATGRSLVWPFFYSS